MYYVIFVYYNIAIVTPRCTHVVYKYFAKSTDLCGEHSPRTTIRTTVLIRPLQFRYVQFVPG